MKHIRSFTDTIRRVIAVCLFFLSGVVLAAEDCSMLDGRARNEMLLIEQHLLKITSLQEYEAAIKGRYDKVESLLASIDTCLRKEAAGDLEAWQQVLHVLRSHARTLVFNHYENWMEVKNSEIELLQKAIGTGKEDIRPDIKGDDLSVKAQSPEKT